MMQYSSVRSAYCKPKNRIYISNGMARRGMLNMGRSSIPSCEGAGVALGKVAFSDRRVIITILIRIRDLLIAQFEQINRRRYLCNQEIADAYEDSDDDAS